MADKAILGLVPMAREGIELADMEGEGVLYCHEKMTMVYLNESSVVIWRLCDGQRTVGEIIDALANAFPDAANKITFDVPEIVELLMREGVLELGEA